MYDDTVKDHLQSTGWRWYKVNNDLSEIGYWAKRFTEVPRCSCNNDREGMQAIIHVHKFHEQPCSYDITVTGQTPDDVWFELKAYAIHEGTLLHVMDAQINSLLTAWKSIVGASR